MAWRCKINEVPVSLDLDKNKVLILDGTGKVVSECEVEQLYTTNNTNPGRVILQPQFILKGWAEACRKAGING